MIKAEGKDNRVPKMLFSHGHMEDIKDFLVGIDTETLVKHESR